MVVVAHDRQIPVGLGKESNKFGLRPIRVLELIDEDVPEAPSDLVPGSRRLADEPEGERDLVAEVDAAVRFKQGLVALVCRRQFSLPARLLGECRILGGERRRSGEAIGVSPIRRGRYVLVLAATEQRGQCPEEARRIAERPVALEGEREQMLAQEDHDLGPAQDAHVRRQAELERVLPDQPVAERVERADRRVRVAIRHQLVHPDLHLGRGLLGEGQGEDLRRPGAPRRDQPRDPAGDHLGLARSCPSHDEERSVAVRHGPELLGVEPAEQGIETSWRVPGGRDGVVDDEPVPDRNLVEGDRIAAGPGAAHDGANVGGIRGHVRIIARSRVT